MRTSPWRRVLPCNRGKPQKDRRQRSPALPRAKRKATGHAATSRVPARVIRPRNTIAHSKEAETIHQISRMLSHNQARRSGLEMTLNGKARNLDAGAEDRK